MLRRLKSKRSIILALALASLSLVGCTGGTAAAGGTSINAPGVKLELGGAGSDNATALQFFLLLTILSLVPAILMMVTSFVRITIVLSFVRNAIGAQQMPPNQVLVGLALFLTLFVMAPTWQRINTEALQPYMTNQLAATPNPGGCADLRPRSRLHDQRAQDGLPDGLHDHGALPGHRHRRLERAHVDGHDDAAAGQHLTAVQAPAVRDGRW